MKFISNSTVVWTKEFIQIYKYFFSPFWFSISALFMKIIFFPVSCEEKFLLSGEGGFSDVKDIYI